MRFPGFRTSRAQPWVGGAGRAALGLVLAPAAAATEGNPTGWGILAPCAGNCALAVYGGTYVEDSMADVLFLSVEIPTDWDFVQGDNLAAVALSRHAGSCGPIDFEPEVGIARRSGRQSVTEVWAALFARYRGFPWDRVVETSLAVSTGVNVASSLSDVEIERTGEASGYRLMHFSRRRSPRAAGPPGGELLFRFHHRSGAYGLFNDVGGGAHYETVGLRVRF